LCDRPEASLLRNFIKFIDTALATNDQIVKVHRDSLHDLFQWLYQELILKLSTELKNTDLVKFLNYKLLLKYPVLADYINVKN